MLISDYKTLNLNHRPYHLPKEDNGKFMVSSKEGHITVFDTDANIQFQLDLDQETQSIDFSEEHQLIFVAFKDCFSIINYKNEIVKTIQGKYDSIFYNDLFLWAIKIIDKDRLCLEVYSSADWTMIASIEFKDIFSHSSCLIYEGVDKQSIVVWVAAGQDGQANYLFHLNNNKLSCQEIPFYDTLPLAFNHTKTNFVLGSEEKFSIYAYPSLEELYTYQFPEDYIILNNLSFWDDDTLLIDFENTTKLFDLKSKTMQDISVAGHEYRETSYYYPTLEGDDDLVNDLFMIERMGDNVIMLCADHRSKSISYSVLITQLLTSINGRKNN